MVLMNQSQIQAAVNVLESQKAFTMREVIKDQVEHHK
jgi:hypothetical protein